MKKFVFIVGLFLCTSWVIGQSNNPVEARDNKLEEIRAKNGVKSMTITSYRITNSGLSSEGRSITVHFGMDGVKIEKNEDLDDDESENGSDPKFKTNYDAAKKTYTTQLLGNDNRPKYVHVYKLDGASRIIELQVTDYARSIRYSKKYEYDKNGNEVESAKYTTSGRLIQKTVKAYYKNNLPQGRMIYEPGDNIKLVSFYEYEFY